MAPKSFKKNWYKVIHQSNRSGQLIFEINCLKPDLSFLYLIISYITVDFSLVIVIQDFDYFTLLSIFLLNFCLV